MISRILLSAMCCVWLNNAMAQSEEPVDESILATSVVGYTHFTTTNPQPLYGTQSSSVSFDTSANKLTISGGTFFNNTGDGSIVTVSVAMRLDMSKLIQALGENQTSLEIFSFNGNGNNSTTKYTGMYLMKTDNDYQFRTSWGQSDSGTPPGPNHSSSLSTDNLPTSGDLNVVLTQGTNGMTVYLGVGDNPDYTSNNTNSANLKWSADNKSATKNVAGLQFGNNVPGAIEQLYVFNSTLTPETQVPEVMAAMTSWASPVAVPEPTGIVFSLISCAGLCVYRKK